MSVIYTFSPTSKALGFNMKKGNLDWVHDMEADDILFDCIDWNKFLDDNHFQQ